ncbi:hypothetical protein [Mesorhizobium sp. KR9-304]|uniref:hypothetical protein n=1 Tax=Mesorhizobium sp. KR9-304 TaxID=3156614 RepID=UPI0032B50923
MRSRLSELSFLPLVIGLTVGGLAAPAIAGGGPNYDRVYADSFGNLVVHSRSGYKRIVVGQGHLARELAEYERPRDRDVVYLDEDEAVPYECWKPAVLLKGRSYMYGLEDGELPDLPGKWCGIPERAAPGAALRRVQP